MNTPADDYLELLARCLTASLYPESAWHAITGRTSGNPLIRLASWFVRWLRRRGLLLVQPHAFDPTARENGTDWPMFGLSMIGLRRMRHLRACVDTVLADGIPGDLIETGVWRGGAIAMMRAVLMAHGVTDRIVWAADSFEGLPSPTHAADRADSRYDLSGVPILAVSLEQVQANLDRFGLLDDQVKFLKGWFRDTLPTAPIERLAVLRLDGDLYESTMDALQGLYRKVSPGGFVIVDDYHGWPMCRKAVEDFRAANHVTAPIQDIDASAVFWRLPR